MARVKWSNYFRFFLFFLLNVSDSSPVIVVSTPDLKAFHQ